MGRLEQEIKAKAEEQARVIVRESREILATLVEDRYCNILGLEKTATTLRGKVFDKYTIDSCVNTIVQAMREPNSEGSANLDLLANMIANTITKSIVNNTSLRG